LLALIVHLRLSRNIPQSQQRRIDVPALLGRADEVRSLKRVLLDGGMG
jgi:hypothetical protein